MPSLQVHISSADAPADPLLLNADSVQTHACPLEPPEWVCRRVPCALLEHLLPQTQFLQEATSDVTEEKAESVKGAISSTAPSFKTRQPRPRVYTPLSKLTRSQLVGPAARCSPQRELFWRVPWVKRLSDSTEAECLQLDVYCVLWEMRRAPQEQDCKF